MNDEHPSSSAGGSAARLFIYWLVVAIPLAWGIWKTVQKLPALFQ